jgi:hypothetical protein
MKASELRVGNFVGRKITIEALGENKVHSVEWRWSIRFCN